MSRIAIKLIGGVLFLVALVFSISNWITIVGERQFLYEQIDAQGNAISATASVSCVEALLIRDYPVLETFAELLLREHQGISFIRIERKDGQVAIDVPPGASIDPAVRGASRIYSMPVLANADTSHAIGKVTLGLSTSQAETVVASRIWALIRNMVISSVMIIVLLLVLLERTVLAPIQRLERAANKTGPDELMASISLSGKDEISRLSRAFNEMRSRLGSSLSDNRQIRNYLTNIINSMPSVLIGVDNDGKVTQWNNQAQQVTGITPDVAIGQPLEQTFPRLAEEMDHLREAMRTHDAYTNPRLASKVDGETRYEDVTVYPLMDDGTEGAVIRVDDVTDRVRIEEAMVQSEKMMSVGGLAAGMAHEINNPLAGMMQSADVLTRRLTEDMAANDRAAKEAGITMDAIRAFMEVRGIPRMLTHINESGERAAEIVKNMLSFARKSDSSFIQHDLTELFDQCVDLAGSDYDLKKKYDFRQIEIIRQYEENLPKISCEGSNLQQVLLNLLRNGAEAMQENDKRESPRFFLRLAHEKDAGMVRIEIEDNGPGMDEATRKRVFEPFFTTKPAGQGTGLGLSVSYFIITENHNGRMAVESTLGHGTKFIVHLPVERKQT